MQGVDYIYSDEPGKRKANSNLPGNLVFTKSSLDAHAMRRDKEREAIQNSVPGYDPQHNHLPTCLDCGKWSWRDYGIPEEWNPVGLLGTSYDQYSRAEAMKGSTQAVMMASGQNNKPTLDDATMPDLTPVNRPTPGNTVVIMGQEAHAYGKKSGLYNSAKKLVGLGGR